MRRTKEEAEKTRCAILAAAETLFLEKGVAHTSLEHIARQAGVTRGAVYWHFANKAHLFNAMLNQVRLPPEQLAERMHGCAEHDPLLTLRELCIDAIANLVHNPQKRRIFTILLRRCEFTEELREAEERHEAFINLFIELCEQQFDSPQVMPRLLGLSLYRLDINFRESAVIGIVGAGGIGATLNTAMDRYEFDSAAAIILVIIAIVMLAEYSSGWLRQRIQ